MKAFVIGVLFVIGFGVPVAFAQEITMSAESEEFYFLVGQPVFFRIEMSNTYGQPVSGTLTSNIEHVDPLTNTDILDTKSNPVNLQPGVSNIDVNLGVHNAPTSLSVDMLFSYVRTSAKLVDLPPITIHIVNTPQEQQESEPVSASSQDAHIPPQQPQQGQMNNAQDRLQNNQLAQDSTALREDIREQIAQQNESVQDILEAARSSPEFAQLDEELASQGYRMSSQSANPDGESSGTFDFEYVNDQNQRANIEGKLKDDMVTEIHAQTQEELDAALDTLRENPKFQELEEQIRSAGYDELDTTVTKLDDGSFEASVSFTDIDETLADISGIINNGTATNVKLNNPSKDPDYLIIVIVAMIIGGIIFYVLYSRYRQKNIESVLPLPPKPKVVRDFIREYRELLDEAAKSFDAGMEKTAYSLVSQALRLGLAHNVGVDTETSNADILHLLDNTSRSFDGLKDCLDISSLVVFAKRESDKADFEKILTTARNLLDSCYTDAPDSERRTAATPTK